MTVRFGLKTAAVFTRCLDDARTRFAAFSLFFWKFALVTVALFALPVSSGASVIVSVTDLAMPVNRGAFFLGGEFSNVVAASWTQNESFSGVTIDASIVSIDSSFRNGTAYLMSMIGPGTTPASEILPPVGFTAPIGNGFGEVPLTVLFSGLNLTAGTYYLVLTAPFANFTSITGSPLTWQVATMLVRLPPKSPTFRMFPKTASDRVSPRQLRSCRHARCPRNRRRRIPQL